MLIYILDPNMQDSAAYMKPALLLNQLSLAYTVAVRLSSEQHKLTCFKGTKEYERLVSFWRPYFPELVAYGDFICGRYAMLTGESPVFEDVWLRDAVLRETQRLNSQGPTTAETRTRFFPWPATNPVYLAHKIKAYNMEPKTSHTISVHAGMRAAERELWPSSPTSSGSAPNMPEVMDFDRLLSQLRETESP